MATDPRQGLRAELRARRHALDARARMAAGQAIADALRPSLGGYVAGYWAVDGEVPLLGLLSGPQDFVYCLPVLQPGKRLRFAPWRAGDALVQNRFGIPEPDLQPSSLLEPEALDHVLVPLLGFDGRGHRLGTGGGYYDRSFAFRHQHRGAPRLVGIGYACQRVERLPAADWDVPLDLVATEKGLVEPAQD
ncbi:5-formyltetrahydrofolate cyclo-ligase [Pseudomarimonas salicorniae]|uniref:5-formyltetrahydrofolate cyclo-ligase n=1 Tax=Pseudomarimonas salicorniae TaxID=2933270 RepID=A0ABT0GHJ9_9GAMM|nr:5-formyltetrahydrofolate cyclo-ligase [Lysobacter sp. CAU 1642]MCK7593822.1 5-formyltetrahydrofolate cyclo-ligase [Lysobacter sp. CAU 1642]